MTNDIPVVWHHVHVRMYVAEIVTCPDYTLKGKGLITFATFLGTH